VSVLVICSWFVVRARRRRGAGMLTAACSVVHAVPVVQQDLRPPRSGVSGAHTSAR